MAFAVCLFDLILYATVNNFLVMWGWVFLGWARLHFTVHNWVESVLSKDKCILFKDITGAQWLSGRSQTTRIKKRRVGYCLVHTNGALMAL